MDFTFRKIAAIAIVLLALPTFIKSMPRLIEPVISGIALYAAYQLWRKEL